MAHGEHVLLTGASGFVGAAVLSKLIDAGFSVRALVRPTSRRDHLADSGATLVPGDLRDPPSIKAAMAGCRYVFHVAADYRLWMRARKEVYESNVAGTRHIMEEALAAGVERVVYTSSVATLAVRPDGTAADESDSVPKEHAVGAYKRSKIAAERLVREMVAERGLPAVIVNPSTPIGPGDRKPTPTGRIIVAAASGQFPAFVETGLNLVHVDDVAEGHLAALRRGEIGERYILGGENVVFSRMLADIGTLVGRRAPRWHLPWYATLPVACIAEAAGLVTGREPLATLSGVRMARHRMFFSSTKAERDLGYRAQPYTQALRDAVQWFHENGYLRSSARLLSDRMTVK